MGALPMAFRNLPADAFPFTMEAYDCDTLKVLYSYRVEGPGVMKIPPKPENVARVGIRMAFANGETIDHQP